MLYAHGLLRFSAAKRVLFVALGCFVNNQLSVALLQFGEYLQIIIICMNEMCMKKCICLQAVF